MVYAFAILALISSWGYSFYQGYQYARKDSIIRQQTAKIRHIEISNRYFRDADQLSKNEASKAIAALETTATRLNQIEADIKAGKLGKACSDKLFDELRKAQR